MKDQINYQDQFSNTGSVILRYGLAIVLIWIGILKFSTYEAEGIKPLVDHSPFLSWGYQLMSTANFSVLIGIAEILSGVLVGISFLSPRISVWGSYLGIATFVVTLTFLFSTPGIIQPDHTFPFISPMPGQFIIKDIVLLGASVWTAGESRLEIARDR